MASAWGSSWGSAWGNSWGAAVAPTADAGGGRYRRINLHAVKHAAKKKKKEDELAELQRLLEDVAKSAPKPEIQPYSPRVYAGPLAAEFFAPQRTEASVKQIMAQAKARAEAERQRLKQQEDEDDEAATMLLLST